MAAQRRSCAACRTANGHRSNPADAATLIAAAWLHDIGYAEDVRDTGFHPLDGGLYLRHRRWPSRIASLVAHHFEALCVASVQGLADRLADFTREDTAVADALSYADQTVGPHGRPMAIEQRLDDMLGRHGPDSPNARAHSRRAPLLRAAGQRVEQRLSEPCAERLWHLAADRKQGPRRAVVSYRPQLFDKLARHGRILAVVDQPASIGALPVAVARAAGHQIAYLPGLVMRRLADLHPGTAKTDAGDAYVIADAARHVAAHAATRRRWR